MRTIKLLICISIILLASAGGSALASPDRETVTVNATNPASTAPAVAAAKDRAATPANVSPFTSEASLKMLQDGNIRYVSGKPQRPRSDAARREETVKGGQKPFASVVSCSDSRVPVEILFDAGIGDLLVVRVGGNTCDADEIGTVEYGVHHLGTPLLIVLGHTRCEAVTLAATGAQMPGSIGTLLGKISPAVEAAKKAHPDLQGDTLVPAAIEANIWHSIDTILSGSGVVRDRVKSGRLRIEGALYDLTTGKVDWLGSHPRQGQLIATAGQPADPQLADHDAAPAVVMHTDASSEAVASQPQVMAPATKPADTPSDRELAETAAPVPPIQAQAAVQPAVQASQPATPMPAEARRPSADGEEVVEEGHGVVLGSRPPVPPVSAGRRGSTMAQDTVGLLERHMAEDLYRQGLAHLAREQYGPAAERFRAAVEMDPFLTAAVVDLAGVSYMQRDYGKAAELYQAVLATDPENPRALRGSALVCASRRQYTQAREKLRQILSKNEKDAQILLDIGDVTLLMGDAPGALQYWSHAASVDPSATSVIRKAEQRLKTYAR